ERHMRISPALLAIATLIGAVHCGSSGASSSGHGTGGSSSSHAATGSGGGSSVGSGGAAGTGSGGGAGVGGGSSSTGPGSSSSGGSPMPDGGPVGLHVVGNQLHDGMGKVVQLHGVNRSGTEYACVQGWGIFDGPSDEASVAAIASWNSNVVRVP